MVGVMSLEMGRKRKIQAGWIVLFFPVSKGKHYPGSISTEITPTSTA